MPKCTQMLHKLSKVSVMIVEDLRKLEQEV